MNIVKNQKIYKKITHVAGGRFTFFTRVETENPAYTEAFDRLDRIGSSSIAKIQDDLDAAGIVETFVSEKEEDVSIGQLTALDIFYTLDKMNTSDLILLSGNIIANDYVQTFISNIISERNKQISMLDMKQK